jgi:hypothetical protein
LASTAVCALRAKPLKGRDVLDQSVVVDGATGPVDIVIGNDTCDVNVTVTDADANPVAGPVVLAGVAS